MLVGFSNNSILFYNTKFVKNLLNNIFLPLFFIKNTNLFLKKNIINLVKKNNISIIILSYLLLLLDFNKLLIVHNFFLKKKIIKFSFNEIYWNYVTINNLIILFFINNNLKINKTFIILNKKNNYIKFFKNKILFKNKIKINFSTLNNIVNTNFFTNFIFFFLRKTKCFNKGRYSRNRQNYRTGFYWSIYVNIVALLGLNFLFYKFCINFTVIWFLFFIFLSVFFFSKIIKYNFFFIKNVIIELSFIKHFFILNWFLFF